ncbi:MAG: ASPIC/UnbV domain-containing protein, partial [Edaphobacter sp.]
LFNDGKLDVVINVLDGHPALLRNVSPDHHHWIEFKLVGGPKSPRDAIGAKVFVTANGMRQRDDIFSGGSFASTHDPRPHFGLGNATKIDAIEVHWPDGAKEKFVVSKVDQIVTLTEGKGTKM